MYDYNGESDAARKTREIRQQNAVDQLKLWLDEGEVDHGAYTYPSTLREGELTGYANSIKCDQGSTFAISRWSFDGQVWIRDQKFYLGSQDIDELAKAQKKLRKAGGGHY